MKTVDTFEMWVVLIGKEKEGEYGPYRAVCFAHPIIPKGTKLDDVPEPSRVWAYFGPEDYEVVNNLRKGQTVTLLEIPGRNGGKSSYRIVNGATNGGNATNGNGGAATAEKPPAKSREERQQEIKTFIESDARLIRACWDAAVLAFVNEEGKCFVSEETIQKFASGIHIDVRRKFFS